MIYLEGTDGVGKTSTIEVLKKYGFDCNDRHKEVFSKNMLFDVTMEDRVKAYVEYLKNHDDIIIFLINNDEKELMDRIYAREIISDFDMDAYKYNQLYVDTYNFMKENNLLYNKLFMIDCTNLSFSEQVNKVKDFLISNNA